MSRLRILQVAAAVALLAAACTSSPSSSLQPTTSAAPQAGSGFTAADLCALVTQAQMSAALGNAVGAGVPSGVNAPSCTWQNTTDPGASATIAASSPDTVGQIPYALQNMPSPGVTAVNGLGDAAYFAAGLGTTAELDIRKGGRAITITVGSTDPNYTQAQQEAAELAIGTSAARNM